MARGVDEDAARHDPVARGEDRVLLRAALAVHQPARATVVHAAVADDVSGRVEVRDPAPMGDESRVFGARDLPFGVLAFPGALAGTQHVPLRLGLLVRAPREGPAVPRER